MIAATTRPCPQLGAIGLLLQEDTFGTPAALCWPVRAKAQVRSYEIDTPDHWIELLDGYGIDVTGQRRAQWSQATGLDTYWLLPDWSALAEDYDVVHLTMNGYLATSGRALGVNPENATFVAGWNPDTSYWLTDVLEICGSPLPWEATEHNSARHWRRADDS
jgi:hypothetical protein